MRFQKAISGLNASPSQIKRKLKTLTIPNYNMDVDEMLVLASQKISPIIEMLVESRSSVEHFISVKEYKDIEEVATIIEIISKALENIGFETNINTVNLDMTKYRNSANSQGYIYVDTSLLLDILELYNVLEYIQEDLRIFYRSIGIHSFVQTESGLISLSSNSSRNSNKIVFKMKKQPLKGSSSFGLLQNEFIVMPSTSDIGPLQGSKSQILARSDMSGNTPSTRRAKSASSFESVEKVEVTDVYCARRILIKCIYDLQEVSDYLGIPRKDVATICSRVEVLDRGAPLLDGADRRSVASADRRDVGAADTGGSTSKKSLAKGSHYEVDETDGQRRCCCDDCFAHFKGSGADTKESDDDQVIICIKGCNENEGDVQIVIRQCPDCKKADGKSAPLAPEATDSVESRRTLTSTKKVSTSEKRIPEEDKRSSKSQTSGYSPSKKSVDIKSEKSSKETQAKALEKPEKDTKGVESKILHNKDSEGSIICSDEEEEEKRPIEKQSYIENQARVSCSRIKLFEKTKFCLLTDTGQELVISLTVTPKELIEGSEKLSIRDIFSENEIPRDLSGSQESAKDASDRVSDRKSRGSKKSATTQQSSAQEPQTYFVADQYIPLGRTKICSSLDFDVTTADSRIRDKGIQNKDNNIMVQLDEFGADNLLRACRPAKCCRKAILNEKMKKCLPYAPSLRSLPLDQDDVSVINQSLQMSLQKVKNSTNLNKDFYGKQNQMYFLNPIYPVMYFFVEEDLAKDNLNDICLRTLVKQKLNFYINIVKDIPHEHNSKYEILYFSVESKLGKNVTNQSVKTYSVGDENNKSNDEKVDVEIAEVISNPLRWLKQKYSKYDERSLLQSQGLIIRNDSLIMRNLRKKKVVPSEHVQTKVNHNKSYISKIPVYQGRKVLCVNPDTEEKIEPQVCDISSGSLPRSQDISEELPAGLQELYRKSPNNNIGVAHKVNNKLDVEISCYDLKAKQSEYCFVQANKRNSKHLYIFNNLALQTSTVFLDNKNCQTSKTLLAYILNPNVHTENFNFKKKRIFKKTYNCENVTGLPNTCDEIENFVVTFDSDHSFSSNFSERDFRLSNSGCPRRQLTERGQEDSLSQSLMKLKETLERYEGINNEIARKSLQQTNINPIEYFVYQVSAYNNDKLNKKPSVMQKIVSKTKGLFSSVEKDMPREYNNPRNCLNLPQPACSMVISCFKRENCKGNMEYRDQKDAVITRAFDDYSKLSKSSNSSKSSMTSSLKSAKRKKKEFYLSRSRSEISLNSLKHICKNKNIKPLPKIEIKKTLSTQMSIQNLGQNKFDSSNMLRDQDSSKIILNYFTRILYEMIMRQMSQDQRCKEVAKNVDPQINICIGTENTSLQELYRKSPNNNIGVAHKVNNKLDVKNSCYDLKAKQSEYCFVQPNKRKSKHLYIFNNLALQTSTIFLDNKNCQTSKTLLAYILNSNVHTENFNFKKKRIFKKTYNCENVLGLPNSCDEIENFVVTFDSDHSFSSNFSERDFMLSNSGCSSRQLTESGQEDSLSQSLIKLKETLERYEHIKNEIARKSLQEANINPIEYFVYQVCACNNDKLNKKSSVMQKIVSKTKGLFSSVEKDMCRKYKNQRNFLNLPQTGREELCFNCGCYFPKSAYNTPGKKPTAMQLICQCPQNNKTKQRTSEPCCKKNNKPKAASNFSRLASASASSLKSLKDCLKKSVSEIFNNGNKNNSLGPCRCGRKVAEKKNVDTICIPEDMHVVICNKKDTSTSTTKDSSTQKCECGKCANFADDGTCCCSHCLGCLDKSFEAKPQNNNVGVETDAKKKHTSQMNKGGQTSDSLERKSKSNKTSSVSDLKVTEQNSKQLETEKEDTISIDTQPGSLADADTTHVPGTIQEVNETDNDITLTSENVNRSEPPKNEIQSKDSRSEKIEHPVETIEDNDAENDDDGNDTTAAYFFVAPPPHLFQQFRLGNGNPFDQYLLNFPQVFHVDRAD